MLEQTNSCYHSKMKLGKVNFRKDLWVCYKGGKKLANS